MKKTLLIINILLFTVLICLFTCFLLVYFDIYLLGDASMQNLRWAMLIIPWLLVIIVFNTIAYFICKKRLSYDKKWFIGISVTVLLFFLTTFILLLF